MRYRVTHTTTYAYEEVVSICHNELRLEPRATPRQRCLTAFLEIEPAPAVLLPELDYFGNPTSFFTVQELHHHMVVSAESELEVEPAAIPDRERTPAWDELVSELRADRSEQGLAVFEMTLESPSVPLAPEFAAYAKRCFPKGRPILAGALELTRRIHTDFEYRVGATSTTTPVEEALAKRHGVCQDFAHVELACLRAFGIPARYVSGYIRTRPRAGAPRLVGTDASHAWVSVWCGAAGWIDLDPTNDVVASQDHVTLAWGRDYGDVAPMRGVILGGGGHSVKVAVEVIPLDGA